MLNFLGDIGALNDVLTKIAALVLANVFFMEITVENTLIN
jgi:hypothetical protein